MTTPDLSFIIPKKYKTIVGLIGSALAFVVPFVLEVSDSLPSPWPAVIGALLAVLTALGIYRAPYVPEGAVMAPATPAVQQAAAEANVDTGEFKNPWR